MFDVSKVKGPSLEEAGALSRVRESIARAQDALAAVRRTLEAQRSVLQFLHLPPLPDDDPMDYCYDAAPSPDGVGPAIGADFFES